MKLYFALFTGLYLSGYLHSLSAEETWIIDTEEDWKDSILRSENLIYENGMATPTAERSLMQSIIKRFAEKQTLREIVVDQSPVWKNWNETPNLGPANLRDAPILLSKGTDDYWIFGMYSTIGKRKQGSRGEDGATFKPVPALLEGFDMPLLTTPLEDVFDAPGGLQEPLGGYHAWQSRDMETWVHHGPVSPEFARWMTSAEYVDGDVYLYYDFPNDQDPHLFIDSDLTDGIPGENVGRVFKDPSDGSDIAVIRDLGGDFHLIYEDWGPIDASQHSWDSPLAGRAVSENGITGFELQAPVLDHRTNPTGKFAEYTHPYWYRDDPENFPGREALIKKRGSQETHWVVRAHARYEIHEPAQNAYGDWAAISIGGQYYLFGDFHPAGKDKEEMSVAWFTSPALNQQFIFCGNIGNGHPDPDICFAEGQFYLVTQMDVDYVSPGPWVETVEARAGADIDQDGKIDQWTAWQEIREYYDYIPGFSKQISRKPAVLDTSELPPGYGFVFEIRTTDSTVNESKPIIDTVTLVFD